MLLISVMVALVAGTAVVDFNVGFALTTVIGNVVVTATTTGTSLEFDVDVRGGATVVALTGVTVVVGGKTVVVVGGSYEAITKAPISCVTLGLVKL